MNVLLVTSSYPAFPDDPSGTAGLFVRDFALNLAKQGHKVVVQPVARKKSYTPDEGITIEPLPWVGGDKELASLNFINPINWIVLLHFIYFGRKKVLKTIEKHAINYSLSFWIVPSGIFSYFAYKKYGVPYDLWALGSDIWKIRKIPIIGERILRFLTKHSMNVYADGLSFCKDVEAISERSCQFLPSTRKLPEPSHTFSDLLPDEKIHLLYVGRYHVNKGPDLLIEAVSLLTDTVKENIYVHMFGIGPLKEKLLEMRKNFDVENIVSINDGIASQEFSNYLSKVSFMLLPSRIESIPVVFSDSMQCGVPVVAMPVGDMPEIFSQYGCGVLAEGVSAAEFSDAIISALNIGSKQYSAGVQQVCEIFNIKNSVANWLSKLK